MAKIETTQIRRTIRRQQLREMVPMADSTIYEMEQRGEFPRRFALSPRCIVWDLAEVEAWLMARRAAPIRRAQHPDVTKRKTRPVKGRDQAPSRAACGKSVGHTSGRRSRRPRYPPTAASYADAAPHTRPCYRRRATNARPRAPGIFRSVAVKAQLI